MWIEGSFHTIDTWIILKNITFYIGILLCHLSITLIGKKLKSMLSIYGMFGEVISILFQMACKQNIMCNLFKYIYNL